MKKQINSWSLKKLISSVENKVSYIQIFGFILIISGVLAIIIAGLFKNDASVIAISFFITMLGVAFAFPTLLEGNEGLSTMRIVVFMVTNVICLLLIKIGWDKESLACIGLDQWWMGVIAFVFGAKATQSYFDNKFVIPKTEAAKIEIPQNDSITTEIANNALLLHKSELLRKYKDIIIEPLEIGNTATNQIGIIVNLRKPPPADFPKSVSAELGNGKQVPLETILNEKGIAHSSIEFRLQNPDHFGSTGSLGCILHSLQTDNERYILTCSHVALGGSSQDLGGLLKENNSEILIQILEGGNEIETGKLIYAKLDAKNDTAIIRLDNENSNQWDNEFSDGNKLSEAVSINNLTYNDEVIFYSSLKNQPVNGRIHKLCSSLNISLRYDDMKVKTFTDLIVVGNNYGGFWSSISEKGDSGSILFNRNFNPFGMIIGGDSQFTYAVPILPILNNTKMKIFQS